MGRLVVTQSEITLMSQRSAVPAAAAGGGAVAYRVKGGPGGPPGGGPPPPKDDYWTALLKLIPGEAIAAFLALNGGGLLFNDDPSVTWIAFGLALAFTPVYVGVRGWREFGRLPWLQMGLAMFAFVLWLFAMGGPFGSFEWYRPAWGAGALLLIGPLLPKTLGA